MLYTDKCLQSLRVKFGHTISRSSNADFRNFRCVFRFCRLLLETDWKSEWRNRKLERKQCGLISNWIVGIPYFIGSSLHTAMFNVHFANCTSSWATRFRCLLTAWKITSGKRLQSRLMSSRIKHKLDIDVALLFSFSTVTTLTSVRQSDSTTAFLFSHSASSIAQLIYQGKG